MDSELLKRACEAAGLKEERELVHGVPMWRQGGTEWRQDNPALPAYVASLLVEKVRELPYDFDDPLSYVAWWTLEPDHIIRAALEILEGGL